MKQLEVQVHILSRIRDLACDDFTERGVYAASEQFYPKPLEEDEKDEQIDYYADGFLTLQDSVLTLTYEEREDMGFEDAETAIFFDLRSPQTITMVRSGDGAVVLRFDPSLGRQMVSYETSALPLEFAMITREVKNTLTPEGGTMYFDYLLEMHGVKTQRNELTLTVRVPDVFVPEAGT